jgi:polysaccharide biosynthesis protein PslH
MNILFFTYDFPFPTTSGGKVRAYNLLKYAKMGCNISLFSFIRPGFEEKSVEELKKIGVDHIEIFPRRKVRDARNIRALFSGNSVFKELYYDRKVAVRLAETVEKKKIDVLHFESFYTAFYMDQKYAQNGVKQIYGSENIEHLLYSEYVKYKAPLLLKPGFTLQAKKIRQEEEDIVRKADATLAVTETEKSYFGSLTKNPVVVIENGVSLKEFSFRHRKKKEGKTILFVGNFDYFPNADAVSFFYTRVFTYLTHENLRFSIVGKGAKQFASFNDKRIVMTEFIDDIKDAYYEADIFVSPIQIGGGTNFKILEAMACGLPVVSFADRVRDIGAVNGQSVLTADDPESFKQQVEKLLNEPEYAEKLAKNARKIIEEKYSWETIGKNLNSLWKTL